MFFIFFLMISLGLNGQKVQLNSAANLSPDELNKVKMHLGFQKRFLEKLGVAQEQTRMISLSVYDDFLDYSRVLKDCCRQNPTATGFYSPVQDQITLYKNEEFEFTFAHELVHALTRESRMDHIPWLREGLADYLGAFYWLPNGQLNKRNLYPIDQLNVNLSKRQLTLFMEADEAQWASLSTNASYGLAWALVNFLHEENRAFFIALIYGLEEGSSPMQLLSTYPGGFKSFAKDFRKYYQLK